MRPLARSALPAQVALASRRFVASVEEHLTTGLKQEVAAALAPAALERAFAALDLREVLSPSRAAEVAR